MRLLRNIKSSIKDELSSFNAQNKVKYFCIGAGKTGTTSLHSAFEELGFVVGNQYEGELLARSCHNGNFEPLIRYCKSAEVFQDVPFCFLDYYKVLDETFPGSKFILTKRSSSEEWYNSLVNFQTKVFGDNELPGWDALRQVDYVYKGWAYENRIYGFKLDEKVDSPYEKEKLIKHYEQRNASILNYFKNRPEDLLVINLSEPKAYKNFCNFINVEPERDSFPWKNKTTEIK